MGYRAIALSQVDGAGGEAIGTQLATRLGFGYLNDGIIAQVAAEQGVDQETVAQAERRKGLVDKIALMATHWGSTAMVPEALPHTFAETGTYLGLIKEAVLEAADRGNVILVAHAAAYACADRTDVLRVSLTAPMPARAARVAAAGGGSEKDAVKTLRQSDAGRAAYLKQTYGVDQERSSDYDMVINTDRMAPDAVIDLIAGLVQAP